MIDACETTETAEEEEHTKKKTVIEKRASAANARDQRKWKQNYFCFTFVRISRSLNAVCAATKTTKQTKLIPVLGAFESRESSELNFI